MKSTAYGREERVADGVVHLLGVSVGIIAVIVMMVSAVMLSRPPIAVSLGIYGAGMLAMLGCSAAYNMNQLPKWDGILRRLDHAIIFLKIAGTYTPFAVIMGGIAGYLLLGFVWTTAIIAAVGKLFRVHWKGLDIAIYLALGWVGVLAYLPLSRVVPVPAIALLAIGGVLYSVGVVFHLWRGLKYQNAIWHAFVLAATGCHFGAVTTAAFA
ncbi:hemolysin III family protein [Hyphomicrobium sp. 802]|uniref:PAQR family membrane homeostasis protein TrhA n=1 Tax=Hyphomicrobium sp. 802 TaxID=1112272 RepID=UPI00045EC138|nr:hemolysin III family protein [Hyphomicrobium sp. 802]